MKTLLNIDRLLIAVFLLLFIHSEKTGIEAQQPPETGLIPRMKIVSQNNPDEPVVLDMLALDIRIVGQIATTTFDMTFRNPNNRILEGEFSFPLANGQTISRFALDIDGELREGVVVEKDKGRTAFEAITRRKADPGLLEMTEGNNFRARVFPIPANGYRRIVIAVEQELPDEGNYDLYQLPLSIKDPVRKFSVHAEVVREKVILGKSNRIGNLNFKQWNNSYQADYNQDNYIPDEMITLELPHAKSGFNHYTAPRDGHTSWFYIRLKPELASREKTLPGKICLYWDKSNSAAGRHIDRELELLDLYFRRIGDLSVELIPFALTREPSRMFRVQDGNWDALRLFIEKLNYDGATAFTELDMEHSICDEILLVSDGLCSVGSSDVKIPKIPVYTINSATVADPSFLNRVSQLSGGTYIDLSTIEGTEALTLLSNYTPRFMFCSIKSGNASDIYPSEACRAGRNFSMAGILIGNSVTLDVNFGYGSAITETKTITITADSSADPDVLRRIWAQKKIAQLRLDPEHNKNKITSIGKTYGIVTPNTSLLVLETLADYIRYEVVPPKEMQAEYYRAVNLAAKSKTDKVKAHFEHVLSMSADQSRWWNTLFPEKPVKQIKDTLHFVEETVRAEIVEAESNMEVPPPPPPPPSSDRSAHRELQAQVEYSAPVVVEESEELMVLSDVKMEKEISGTRIEINAWDPETPYLKVLEYAAAGKEYATYLRLKMEYGGTPSFYLDASDFFAKKGKLDSAVVILSNLAELKLEVPQLLRAMGKKLMVWKKYDLAIAIFQKVVDLRPEEPQSFRDLGLAYEAAGKHAEALRTLYEVVNREWDGRFADIELIVLNEINDIITSFPATDHSFIDRRLVKKEPVDIRVVLTWDTDNCDMDLWVTSPSGEKCFYEHKLTSQGGKISDDFTMGYGPEEFMIKKASAGIYKVHANYFGTSSNSMLAPVNLHLAFYSNYGRPDEKKQEVVLRLTNQKDVVEVGQFTSPVH